MGYSGGYGGGYTPPGGGYTPSGGGYTPSNGYSNGQPIVTADQGGNYPNSFNGYANPTAGEDLASQSQYNQAAASSNSNSFEMGTASNGQSFQFQTQSPLYESGGSLIATGPVYGFDPSTQAYATFDASPNYPTTFSQNDSGQLVITRAK